LRGLYACSGAVPDFFHALDDLPRGLSVHSFAWSYPFWNGLPVE
jgi:hypothetical protein